MSPQAISHVPQGVAAVCAFEDFSIFTPPRRLSYKNVTTNR